MPPSKGDPARRLLDDCFLHDRDRLHHQEAVNLLRERILPLTGSQTLPLDRACGHILAEDIAAQRLVPPADNSAVDGYAFAHADYLSTGGNLPVSARLAAGQIRSEPLIGATAARIFTGALMPPGADTVAMQEDCETGADGGVRIPAGLKPGANRRKAGEDVKPGDIIAAAGSRLDARAIAALASMGLAEVRVRTPLRIALLSGGDELVEPGKSAGTGQIYDTNRHMLKALLAGLPVEIDDLGILPDRPEVIEKTLASAARSHDAILSSGGTSAGEEDHIIATLDRLGKRHLWQLAIKPGRPMSFGQIGDAVFFGLPGNPVACLVCFLLYIRPALIRLAGADWAEPRRYLLPAAFSTAKKPDRREFWRGMVVAGPQGRPALDKFERDGSGLITGLRRADGLIEVPEAVTSVKPGDLLRFIPWSEFGL
ncbi:MAG: molybdopterin molybdotransferase MoeA [Nitratireductor sp.]|nr:molybdopterin molybdotransferase MoeA [Nitratireductor sp.]